MLESRVAPSYGGGWGRLKAIGIKQLRPRK